MCDQPASNAPLRWTDDDARVLGRVYEAMRRGAESWIIQRRMELADSRIALHIVVLKPICEDCCARLDRPTWMDRALSGSHPSTLEILLPEDEDVMPPQVRFYDSGRKCVHLIPPEKPYQEPHRVNCTDCGQRTNSSSGDDIINVYEQSFLDYFHFRGEDDDGPGRMRGRVQRQRILELYRSRCFDCGVELSVDNFTLDHIVPRSNGGPSLSPNLQPLCLACNQRKANMPVTEVKIALDMLLRPMPSDSFEGPVW